MMRGAARIWCLGWGLWLLSAQAAAQDRLTFKDVTSASGVRFRHTDGSSGRYYIVESFSGGLALLDYDLDGDLDIYFLNGSPLPGAEASDNPRNALYRNDGQWRFTDVTTDAGVGAPGYGLGVCAADYDNDGFADLYVSNFGPNVLYHNNGDGTFNDVTSLAGVAIGQHVGAGVCFLDVDNDGNLDLYVANYIEYSLDQHKPHIHKGLPAYPSPLRYQPASHVLFRSAGDGTFADASRESGIAKLKGYGMGLIAADYDDDGDQDLFVANDQQANFLWQNDGTGKFTDVAVLAGTAFDLAGNVLANMGVDAADFNNDGLVDFHVTTYSGEFATLFRSLGRGAFEDATRVTGAGDGTFPHVKWGNGFADFDNDGHRDLFMACGHLDDRIHLRGGGGSTAFAVPNIVLQNLGNSRFRNVSADCGDGLKPVLSSRGAALGDLDGDGDLDIVVLNSREQPTLIRNETSTANHWLSLRLVGGSSNRSAVGARVRLHGRDVVLVDEVHSGRGYQSDFGQWLHFGLASVSRAAKIEIRWPSGGTSVLTDLDTNRAIVVREMGGFLADR
jgi:hypothetical protein